MMGRGSSRRRFVQSLGGLALAGGLGACSTPRAGRAQLRVVVVGGGFAGATAAKYLRLWGGGAVDVTLVERQRQFISCPLSNLVLSGALSLDALTHSYDGLRARGVRVVHAEVTEIDPVLKRVRLGDAGDLGYDKLVLAPGIDFMTGAIEGLETEAGRAIVHAWKAGPQTVALRAQLEAMPDGGVWVMAIPKAPYRCPPGPYERVCQVARYFKTAKPRSKIIVLDGNPDITSKKGLFSAAWNERYTGLIDYRPNALVTEVDAAQRTLITEMGDKVQGDALNVIPPQRGSDLALRMGVLNAQGRWAMVDWRSLESTALKDVHVIGDTTLAAPGMPKSGHMANQHGKTVAAALVEMLHGRPLHDPTMTNTCYSFVDTRSAVHVASVHQWVAAKQTLEPVVGAGGLSGSANELEAEYAHGWARTIWRDTLG